MNGLTNVISEWTPLQKKVFARWINFQSKNQLQVSDITKNLSDGVALVQLAKILTRKVIPHSWKAQPKRIADMIMNCDLSIEMFSKDGIKLSGISGKDISSNNEKAIPSLIWALISHYSINKAAIQNNANPSKNNNIKSNFSMKNSKQAIFTWVNERLVNYPNIQNFTPYGSMLCALLDSYVPEKINYFALNQEDSKNIADLAINTMKELKIPVFVDSEEIIKNNDKIDEKSLLTQLSVAKLVLDKYHVKRNNSEVSQLKSEIEKLKEQLAEYKLKNEQLAKRLSQSEANEAALKKSLKSSTSEEEKIENEKEKSTLVISVAQRELKKLREENKNLLKSYNKLKLEFEELKFASLNLKDIKYQDCQTAGIISSLRIAKEKAEKLAAEYKEAKDKALKQADLEKKEKVRVKIQLENIQASIKKSLNKAESAQQQIEKTEAELYQQKRIKNKALLDAISMRTALELALSQVEEAEQKALDESDEKILIEAELNIQMKENENLLKQINQINNQ